MASHRGPTTRSTVALGREGPPTRPGPGDPAPPRVARRQVRWDALRPCVVRRRLDVTHLRRRPDERLLRVPAEDVDGAVPRTPARSLCPAHPWRRPAGGSGRGGAGARADGGSAWLGVGHYCVAHGRPPAPRPSPSVYPAWSADAAWPGRSRSSRCSISSHISNILPTNIYARCARSTGRRGESLPHGSFRRVTNPRGIDAPRAPVRSRARGCGGRGRGHHRGSPADRGTRPNNRRTRDRQPDPYPSQRG